VRKTRFFCTREIASNMTYSVMNGTLNPIMTTVSVHTCGLCQMEVLFRTKANLGMPCIVLCFKVNSHTLKLQQLDRQYFWATCIFIFFTIWGLLLKAIHRFCYYPVCLV